MSITRRFLDTLRHTYRRIVHRQDDARTREVVEVLKQVSLFQGFSGIALRELAEVMHQRSYKRDEFLYYQNDPGLGLYLVQRGRVRLLTEDDDGSVHELYHASANEFFGELSILGDYRRMETAQAATETNVFGFFIPDLKTILKRNPPVGAAVVMALARHLATQQVTLMQRLAENTGKVAALRMLDGATPHSQESSRIDE